MRKHVNSWRGLEFFCYIHPLLATFQSSTLNDDVDDDDNDGPDDGGDDDDDDDDNDKGKNYSFDDINVKPVLD